MKSILSIAMILLSTLSYAAGTGSITGKAQESLSSQPIPGIKVILSYQNQECITNRVGRFNFKDIPEGTYTLTLSGNGYQTRDKEVTVIADSTISVNIDLSPPRTPSLIFPPPPCESEDLAEDETIDLTDWDIDYAIAPSASKAMSFNRGMQEGYIPHNTEEYDKIDENTYFDVIQKPLSTFAVDVDAASYANARRFIMQNQLPYKDAVRSEEFINYFNYDYKQPQKDHPLSINLEYGDCPWNQEHKLVHIGLRGIELARDKQKPSNLVFLIDVSGSMNYPEKLPLLKRAFKLLVDQLNPKDKIAMVVYASQTGLVLPATSGEEKKTIIDALDRLHAGGSTAGGAGIQLAYKVAKENFIKDGNNRVILATDGDFNVGISSTSELVRFVESQKDEGIFLTILGFGMGNYKDNRLQEIADKGNGTHAYIDNIMEAKKVLVNEISSTLFTIAKDVKIQVEFNPAEIKSYRLIGYENRKLEDKDFRDDKKDAGEIGAGHTVTALYEVIENTNQDSIKNNDLKYQETHIKQNARNSDEVLTVSIRYKDPDGDKAKEFSKVLNSKPLHLYKTSDNFRFSATVAEFAMLLRGSEFKGDSSFESILKLAEGAKGPDTLGYRAEFIDLVKRAELLMETDIQRD